MIGLKRRTAKLCEHEKEWEIENIIASGCDNDNYLGHKKEG